MTDKPKQEYTVAVQVSSESVHALITGAIEYGSGYWVRFIHEIAPSPEHVHRCEDGLRLPSPMCEGGAYIFRDREASYAIGGDQFGDTDENHTPLRLDLESIRRGLKAMADKHPRHFGDVVSGRDDSITADVFLQCCLLGDIFYG
jgi:hypothetical protein